QVTVRATDGEFVVSQMFRVDVVHVNQPPVFTALPNQVLEKNSGINTELIDLTQYASDPDGDALTFSITGQTNIGVVWCTITDDIYIYCMTQAQQVGVSQVTVQVTDGEFVATQNFRIDVVENRLDVVTVRLAAFDKSVADAWTPESMIMPATYTIDGVSITTPDVNSPLPFDDFAANYYNVVADRIQRVHYAANGFAPHSHMIYIDTRLAQCLEEEGCVYDTPLGQMECGLQETYITCVLDGLLFHYTQQDPNFPGHLVTWVKGMSLLDRDRPQATPFP
ncbi:MAG: Ig-like domain-containing protein, partial [Candidatus Woesearchaeota archaeon]